MDTLQRKPHFLFSIGFGLISLIGFMDLVTAVSFFLRLPLAQWQFPLSVILTVILQYLYVNSFYNAEKLSQFLKTTGSVLLITLISILVAGHFYDISFDGQEYHQEAVYQLGHNHWNPFYELLPKYVNGALWVNNYPKQVETGGAIIYAMTGQIETGKALNFMLLIASFCLTFTFIKQYTSLKPVKVMLVTLLFTFNPIAVSQIYSYMVDGQMASLILCLLVLSFYVYHNASWDKLLLFAVVIFTFINVKFSTIVFAGIFIVFLLIMLLLKKNMKQFWRVFTAATIGTFLAVIIVGFNPFVTNTIRYQNVFYPVFGKNKVDIIVLNTTPGFQKKNRFEKMFITIFSHTDNIDARIKGTMPQLKVPFTLNKTDIKTLAYPDIRIGGFGPFFSGILLLSIVLALILVIKYREVFFKHYMAPFLIMLSLSIIVFEEAWWARYIPQFWFIPIILLIIIEVSDKKWIIALKNFTYIVMFANIGLMAYMITQTNILKTAEIDYQLQQFKAADETIGVDLHEFNANRVRLAEHHIPFVWKSIQDTTAVKIVYSRARISTSKPLPELPLPWLLKMENKLKGKQ